MPSESTTALGKYHRAFWVSQHFQKSCFPTMAYCIFCDMSQFTTPPPPPPPTPHPLGGAQIRSIPGGGSGARGWTASENPGPLEDNWAHSQSTRSSSTAPTPRLWGGRDGGKNGSVAFPHIGIKIAHAIPRISIPHQLRKKARVLLGVVQDPWGPNLRNGDRGGGGAPRSQIKRHP